MLEKGKRPGCISRQYGICKLAVRFADPQIGQMPQLKQVLKGTRMRQSEQEKLAFQSPPQTQQYCLPITPSNSAEYG